MKISLITVTHNSASVISTCLESVDRQVYQPYEHLIIDGASTDETISTVHSHLSGTRTIISEPDQGIYDAMNKGVKKATGDIVGFLNSDDYYVNENILYRVVEAFKDGAIDACYGDLCYVSRNNTNKIIRYWKSSIFKPGAFSKGWAPPHPTFFVRRSIFEKYGHFDLSLSIASDVELMMRFLEVHRISVHYMPLIMVKMRMGGISNKSALNIFKQNKEVIDALKRHHLPFNRLFFSTGKIFSRISQYIQRP